MYCIWTYCCLHFFPWNLYSYMRTLMSLPLRLLHITTEITWDPCFMIYFFWVLLLFGMKKIKIMFLVFWLVLEHMECIVAKFNMKINEVSWNILLLISLKCIWTFRTLYIEPENLKSLLILFYNAPLLLHTIDTFQ